MLTFSVLGISFVIQVRNVSSCAEIICAQFVFFLLPVEVLF